MAEMATTCPVDHADATCGRCGAEHVVVGWAHICRACWDENEREYQNNYLHGVVSPCSENGSKDSRS